MGKGFGKQILQGLIQYCKEQFDAKEFIYSARDENTASNRLAKSFGFSEDTSTVLRDGGIDGNEIRKNSRDIGAFAKTRVHIVVSINQ